MVNHRFKFRAARCGLLLAFLVALVLLSVPVHFASAQPLMNSRLLYFEDFVDHPVGQVPTGWTLNVPGQAHVVMDPDIPSGKALYIVMDPQSQQRDTHIGSPVWDFDGTNPARIVYEYQVRWIRGGGVAFYVTGAGGGHNIDLSISNEGQLRYRDSRLTVLSGGMLQDGWNHVRVAADRERNEVYIYLNDMDQPLAGPFPFRNPVESWQGAKFFMLNNHSSSVVEPVEAYYGDLKVWIEDNS